jgi:hypothetical protein
MLDRTALYVSQENEKKRDEKEEERNEREEE